MFDWVVSVMKANKRFYEFFILGQLLGIAKLSLHQLYMSYRDQRIAKTLLKSQVSFRIIFSWILNYVMSFV